MYDTDDYSISDLAEVFSDIAANRVSDAWTPIFRACGKAGVILPRPRSRCWPHR